MTPPPVAGALSALNPAPPRALKIPDYLEKVYWWAYVHPRAVRWFEQEWMVNLILFGNYARLRDDAVAELSGPGGAITGRLLQVACVYGNLTPRIRAHLAPDAHLDVVDILPIQLKNLAGKLPADERISLIQGDSTALAAADASYNQVLLFFLLHEQPESVRRATLAEAFRVVKPGGKIVIVDYHQPSKLHPLRLLMRGVFARLEPYAMDLWHNPLDAFLPAAPVAAHSRHRTWFGGLYQKLVLTR